MWHWAFGIWAAVAAVLVPLSYLGMRRAQPDRSIRQTISAVLVASVWPLVIAYLIVRFIEDIGEFEWTRGEERE